MKLGNTCITKHFWLVSTFLIAMLVLLYALLNNANSTVHSTQMARNDPLVLSCCSQRGTCRLKEPQPYGSFCYCISYGIIPGFACYP